MKVTVDRTRCEGHALCAAVAPDAFSIDEDDDLAVVSDENPGKELWAQVRAAAGSCPVIAISVTEDVVGE